MKNVKRILGIVGFVCVVGCKNEATKACQSESVESHGAVAGHADSDCDKCCERFFTSARSDVPKSGTNVCACNAPPSGPVPGRPQ